MDIEKIHKLREQCLVRFPLRINQYNHYIEDANGCVIAVVYGTAGNAAPYLVEAANALPELLDEIEQLRKTLNLACSKICHHLEICPADLYEDWEGCQDDKCRSGTRPRVECWERYFLEKARGE